MEPVVASSFGVLPAFVFNPAGGLAEVFWLDDGGSSAARDFA